MTQSIHQSLVFYLHRARTCRKSLLARITPRALHNFRISLRRLESALRLEKPLLGKARFKRGMAGIKRLQKVTGPLREDHVSSQVLKAEGLVPGKEVQVLRGLERKKEEELQAALAARTWDRFFSEMERAFADLEREVLRKKARRKMNQSFLKEMGRVREALEDYHFQGPSRRALHHLRIRSKRLRYGLEQFEFLDPPQRKKLLKASHRVHDALGRLRDLQTAEKGIGLEEAKILSVREGDLRQDAIESIQRLEKVMS